ncbi:Fc receptor-like protein 5 isoform X2 [Protopterus annectens]|uniref:Fc receptor-like protein 5 isoform X2 n=1 Tax=Protopterus annectens TaxID=7888 RepID=UPI001CFAC3DF|nr:Fc receptor-like protein 5 isoform X2 [Protopterus annectens]
MYSFYKGQSEIQGKQTSRSHDIVVSGSSTGSTLVSYTCRVWKRESDREIESLPSRAVSLAVTDRPVTPTISVSPSYNVYIRDEPVTLWCYASYHYYEGEMYSFYKGQSEIQGKQTSQSHDIVVSGSSTGSSLVSYTCRVWKRESDREIESLPSRAISLAITDRPVTPTIYVYPRYNVYIRDETVTLWCSTSESHTGQKYSFYKGQSEIQGKQTSPSHDIVVSGSSTGSSLVSYTCRVWKQESDREIESLPSTAVSLAVTDPLPTPTLRVNSSENVFIYGEIINFECQSNNEDSCSHWTLYGNGQLVRGNFKYGERYSLEAKEESSAGKYHCKCERTVLSRIIVSDNSSSIHISIFASPEKPNITVWSEGETVNIYCEVPHLFKATKAFFYKEDELIYTSIAEDLKSISSFNFTIVNTNSSNEGNYTCRYETTLSSRILNSASSEPLFFRVQEERSYLVLIIGTCTGIAVLLIIVVIIIIIVSRKARKSENAHGQIKTLPSVSIKESSSEEQRNGAPDSEEITYAVVTKSKKVKSHKGVALHSTDPPVSNLPYSNAKDYDSQLTYASISLESLKRKSPKPQKNESDCVLYSELKL